MKKSYADHLGVAVKTSSQKLIRHRWFPIPGTPVGRFQRFFCIKCGCEKGFSQAFGQVMYMDRFGKIHYKAPECVLPNTKL